MKIYTIHSTSDEDEAFIGLGYGFFTEESEVISAIEDLEERAQDPDDDEYSEDTQFWYNAYEPNESAGDIGYVAYAG